MSLEEPGSVCLLVIAQMQLCKSMLSSPRLFVKDEILVAVGASQPLAAVGVK